MAATEVVPVLEAFGSILPLIVLAEENMDVCIKKKLEMILGILTWVFKAADVKKHVTHLENVGI